MNDSASRGYGRPPKTLQNKMEGPGEDEMEGELGTGTSGQTGSGTNNVCREVGGRLLRREGGGALCLANLLFDLPGHGPHNAG